MYQRRCWIEWLNHSSGLGYFQAHQHRSKWQNRRRAGKCVKISTYCHWRGLQRLNLLQRRQLDGLGLGVQGVNHCRDHLRWDHDPESLLGHHGQCCSLSLGHCHWRLRESHHSFSLLVLHRFLTRQSNNLWMCQLCLKCFHLGHHFRRRRKDYLGLFGLLSCHCPLSRKPNHFQNQHWCFGSYDFQWFSLPLQWDRWKLCH